MGLGKRLVSSLMLLCFSIPSGCGGGWGIPDGRKTAAGIVFEHQWQSITFDTGIFLIQGYAKDKTSAKDLVVYIEGDGNAWNNRETPSDDPTPQNPMALRLAVKDPHSRVMYLARPGQYHNPSGPKHCSSHYWTTARFSKRVINATEIALNQAKERMNIERLHLVGYSGGGALAVLLASRRGDIHSVITVCGNLDHDVWTRHHGVTPLWDSLNPALAISRSEVSCPQLHLAGGRDTIVPTLVLESYRRQIGSQRHEQFILIPDYDHTCCWAEHWPDLLLRYRPVSIPPAGGLNRPNEES